MTFEAVKGYAGVAYDKAWAASTYIANGTRNSAVSLYAWGVANPVAAGAALLALVTALELGRRLQIIAKVQTLISNGCAWVASFRTSQATAIDAETQLAQREQALIKAVEAYDAKVNDDKTSPKSLDVLGSEVLAAGTAVEVATANRDKVAAVYTAYITKQEATRRAALEGQYRTAFTAIVRPTSDQLTEANVAIAHIRDEEAKKKTAKA